MLWDAVTLFEALFFIGIVALIDATYKLYQLQAARIKQLEIKLEMSVVETSKAAEVTTLQETVNAFRVAGRVKALETLVRRIWTI